MAEPGREADLTAEDIIGLLELERHPEGGWFRQTFVDLGESEGRAHSTAIYYLLEGDEGSAWHRVDATEVWHWYAGAPMQLMLCHESKTMEVHRLGPDFPAGERPQAIVPRDVWQSAKCLGRWTLVGCTVAPGFRFSGFEIAPEGWQPATAADRG